MNSKENPVDKIWEEIKEFIEVDTESIEEDLTDIDFPDHTNTQFGAQASACRNSKNESDSSIAQRNQEPECREERNKVPWEKKAAMYSMIISHLVDRLVDLEIAENSESKDGKAKTISSDSQRISSLQ